ncbi:MAG: hypothetical protein KC502_16500 [Myxococcales bacterium]|nr:hypothetical protein [Myxococcales bacterium]
MQVRNVGATTDRILKIHWAGYPDVHNRKQRWGGLIGQWGHDLLRGDVVRIPNSVPIHVIEAALNKVLRDSDAAVLVYPYGNKRSGASAMRVRTYNC